MPIARLQAFYRKYYQPDNAVLMVAGKFDEAKTLAHHRLDLRQDPEAERASSQPTYTRRAGAGRRAKSVTLRRAGDTPIVMALYHVPAGPSPDFAPTVLATTILGGPEFRLHKALVVGNLAAQAFGAAQALAEPGYAYFGAELKSDQSIAAARDALLAAVEGPDRPPFTEAELDRAKNIWQRGFTQTLNDPQRVGLGLSEYIAEGDWRLGFDRRDRIRSATLADVNRVAGQYFVTSNRTLGSYIPSPTPVRAPAPAKVDVAALMKTFKGGEAVVAGENFDASVANIDRRTTIATLPGPAGVKVALLPKTTRGGKVIVSINLQLGDAKSLFGKDLIGDATASMLSRGTVRLSREELATAFEKLQASWSVGGSAEGASVRLETTKANLPAALALGLEVLRTPRFDPAEFEQMKTAWVAGIESSRSEPQALVSQQLARYGNPYPKGDVRYAESFDETLQEIGTLKLDDLRAFHHDFYGASQAVVSAVGDFDAPALTAQLQQGLGDWTSPAPFTRVPQPYVAVATAQFRIEVKDKQNAFSLGQLGFPLRESDREYQALRLGMQIFGGSGGGTGWLWDRIREKDGLSYGVGATVSGGAFNANATWSVYAISANQNVERVKAALDQELVRARRDGFTADELKRAKESLIASSRLARAQDGALAGALVSFVERGKTPKYMAELDDLRAQITLDEVNAAFRKYIVPEQIVYAVAGELAGAKAAAGGAPDAVPPITK